MRGNKDEKRQKTNGDINQKTELGWINTFRCNLKIYWSNIMDKKKQTYLNWSRYIQKHTKNITGPYEGKLVMGQIWEVNQLPAPK